MMLLLKHTMTSFEFATGINSFRFSWLYGPRKPLTVKCQDVWPGTGVRQRADSERSDACRSGPDASDSECPGPGSVVRVCIKTLAHRAKGRHASRVWRYRLYVDT